MIIRRDFIKKTGLVAAATLFFPSRSIDFSVRETGLILYTLRNEMMKDPDATLKKVADIGYNWIEAASYSEGLFYNQKPADFRKKVENYGLKLVSTHSGINEFNLDKAVDDAASAGMKYLVLPSLPAGWRKSSGTYRQAADFFNIAGEKCKNAGMKFGYHNHRVEFKKTGGIIPYDLLISNTDPDLVTFELDLCWITAAGQSAVEYMRKYPGRFELFHMKDMYSNKKDATMGEGIIDFKPIFALTKTAGMKYFFVEQDNCNTHTPLESIRISRDFILSHL